jgi:hypothetical protein
MTPTWGALGLIGALTNTLFDGTEVHADEINVTVNVYEPIGKFVKLTLGPMPVCVNVVGPGPVAVIVHCPVVGKFDNGTVPVVTPGAQFGCCTNPAMGAGGFVGIALIFTVLETADVHGTFGSIQMNVYAVPGDKLPTVAVEPEPDCVGAGNGGGIGALEGIAYNCQLPFGKPTNVAVAVALVHVG